MWPDLPVPHFRAVARYAVAGTLVRVATPGLHERLLAAAGDRTYRHLGELTRTNAETVRRYMQGQAPSAEFLVAFCEALGINGHWLLTGQGPMHLADVRSHELGRADPGELLAAVSATLERLIERVDRLELFVQVAETRLRAHPVGAGSTSRDTEHGRPGASVEVRRDPQRVQSIAGAVAKRSRPDDR